MRCTEPPPVFGFGVPARACGVLSFLRLARRLSVSLDFRRMAHIPNDATGLSLR